MIGHCSKHRVRFFSLLFASFVFVAVQTALGQATLQGTGGQPLYVQSSTVATTDASGTVIDVYVKKLGSTDSICKQIHDVWANGGAPLDATLDARGFTGQKLCVSTDPQPMIPNNARGRLLLGNVYICTPFAWAIPTGVELVGLGPSGANGDGTTVNTTCGTMGPAINTVIAVDPSLSSFSGAVLKMGTGTASKGVKIKSLTVDCLMKSGCIGIENLVAGQGSTIEDVAINNAPVEGLHVVIGDQVNGLAAGYSGPYRNITVQSPYCKLSGVTCSAPAYDPMGILVECTTATCTAGTNASSSPITVHFDNITASDNGVTGTLTGDGFFINGASVILTNSHVEYYGTNLMIGDNSRPTNGVKIVNVSFHGTGVVNGKTSTNVQIIGISTSEINGILDNRYPNESGHHIVQRQFLGFYMLGPGTSYTNCTSGCPALLTSDYGYKWRAPANPSF